jgi:hypothetical protein
VVEPTAGYQTLWQNPLTQLAVGGLGNSMMISSLLFKKVLSLTSNYFTFFPSTPPSTECRACTSYTRTTHTARDDTNQD